MTIRAFSIIVVLTLLADCRGVREPATKYYKLDIPATPAAARPPSAGSLRIEPFRTSDLLRQDRIVYRPSPVEVGFYEYHRWAEPPTDSVTKALADQLTKRRVFQSIDVSDGAETSDYVLKGFIERLQEVDYGGTVRAQVSISATLEDRARQKVIWSSSASSERPVGKSDVQAVVAAMGQASQQSIEKLMTDFTRFVELNRGAAATAAAVPR
jgi:ABC-type uncharacterized transport system auxiliary subunit